jgi:hypothetical protein
MLEAFIFGMQFIPNTLVELLQMRIWLEVSVLGDANTTKLEGILKEWEGQTQAAEIVLPRAFPPATDTIR